MARKKVSRNARCPCGSGKKYKHCCYGKGVEDDLGLGSGRQQPQYPIGTVAMYGPDDKTTTKIAAGVILHDGAEAIMKRWVATDATTNPKVQQELKDFFLKHGVKQVAISQGTDRNGPEAQAHPAAAHGPAGELHHRHNDQMAWLEVLLRLDLRLPWPERHRPHIRDEVRPHGVRR